ncbi:MAG: DUF971 domain-containing protein, partial [Acidobacteria bacterium]|nr:DUF971 domain-containing protein [Acidobacteriota bacterium]
FCEEFDMPLLARIPIDPEICNAGDAGKPLVIDYPERPSGKALLNLTDTILMKLEESQTVQLFHVEWQDLGFLERRPTPPPSEPSGLSVNNVWQVSTDEFGIEFADGKVWIQSARNLRLECPCAACVNEWTHEKILKPEDVKPDLSIVAIQSVGRYALRFVFDDGHDSGLFHFDRLRKLADQTA